MLDTEIQFNPCLFSFFNKPELTMKHTLTCSILFSSPGDVQENKNCRQTFYDFHLLSRIRRVLS